MAGPRLIVLFNFVVLLHYWLSVMMHSNKSSMFAMTKIIILSKLY